MKKGIKVQCSGVKTDSGERCTLWTRDSSGMCHKHREQLNKETEYALMKCSKCPITTCAYAEIAPGGLCFFEVADTVKDFDEQWKVFQAMKDQLKLNRLLLNRMERELSRRDISLLGTKGDTTNTLMKNYNALMAINGGQLTMFGKFMGWASLESEDDKVADRKKNLTMIFTREKEKDKKAVEDKEDDDKAEEELEEKAEELAVV